MSNKPKVVANETSKEPQKTTEKVAIRIIGTPTGKYNLANSHGDVVTLSPELTKRMLAEGDAEIVK